MLHSGAFASQNAELCSILKSWRDLSDILVKSIASPCFILEHLPARKKYGSVLYCARFSKIDGQMGSSDCLSLLEIGLGLLKCLKWYFC